MTDSSCWSLQVFVSGKHALRREREDASPTELAARKRRLR